MSRVIKSGSGADLQLQGISEAFQDGHVQEAGGKVSFNTLAQLVGNQLAKEKTGTVPAGEKDTHHGGTRGKQDQDFQEKGAVEEAARASRAEAETLRREAAILVEQSRLKAQEIESDAYNQGFAQGQKDGEELGRRQFEATGQRLEKVIQALKRRGDEILHKYEAQMVKLCLAVARRIVLKELAVDPGTVNHSIRAAMEKVIDHSELTIRLHPKDAELVGQLIEKELEAPGGHPLTILPDTRVEPGGCLIETGFGLVDATMTSKWEAITEAVDRVLSARAGISRDAVPKHAEDDLRRASGGPH